MDFLKLLYAMAWIVIDRYWRENVDFGDNSKERKGERGREREK